MAACSYWYIVSTLSNQLSTVPITALAVYMKIIVEGCEGNHNTRDLQKL